MKLESISIKNFRNINEIKDFKFSDFNVLVGENNVGKTNILKAIYKVLKINESPYRVKFSEEDFYLDRDNKRAEKIVIDLNFTKLDENDEVAFISSGIDFENNRLSIRLESIWDDENNDARVEIFFLRQDDDENERGESFKLSNKKYIPFYYIDAYRDIWRETKHSQGELRQIFKDYNKNFLKPIEIQLKSSRRKLKVYIDNQNEESDLTDIQRLLQQLNDNNLSYSESDLDLLPEELDAVKENLLNIKHKLTLQEKLDDLQLIINGLEGMGKIKESLEDNLSLFVPETNQLELEIGRLTESDLLDDSKFFLDNNPIFKQGSGYQNSFVIALKLSRLLANIRYSEEKISNLIIAIEEPEAHMHPHLQRSFMNKLKSKQREFLEEFKINVQFIITTHSPFVLSQVDKSQICLIKKNKNLFRITRLDDLFIQNICSEISKDKLKHFDHIFRTFPEIFLSRGVIIVEGQSEYGAIPEMAKMMADVDLDELGLTVILANGKKTLKYIYMILKQFTNCVAIRDKDSGGNNDDALVLNREEPYFTTNENDFEAEIVNSVDNWFILKKILMNLSGDNNNYLRLINRYVPESQSLSLEEIIEKWDTLNLENLLTNIDKERLISTLKSHHKNALFWSVFFSEIHENRIPHCYKNTIISGKNLVI